MIAKVSYLIILITIVIGFASYRNRSGILKLLPWYLCLVFTLEMIAYVLLKTKRHNMEVYDIMTIVEFSYFSALFYRNAQLGYSKYMILIFTVLFAGSLVLFYGNIYRYTFYNLISTFMSILFLVVMSVDYLIAELRSNNIISFNNNPMIWISIGLLLYMSCSAFIVISNYLKIVYTNHSLIHNAVTFVSILSLYSCLSISLLCKKK
ncbi:hypothetical protein DBR32_00525 [Taibaiella sp. KBW10]|uniref:hypothetical protein n=1 Tax=Taibaiella sp. KBW10 TaxID=2153357 RepID=UPI000F59C135|nr:hypothetical protein [Taibaiella sp. KBW10]RQO32132.1 hypothetical protein DBR32_00525 [Taibaiella sp. KBW10]